MTLVVVVTGIGTMERLGDDGGGKAKVDVQNCVGQEGLSQEGLLLRRQ